MSRLGIFCITFVLWWKEEPLSIVNQRDKHLCKEAQLVPDDGFDTSMPHVQEASNAFSMVATLSWGLRGVIAHYGRQNCQTHRLFCLLDFRSPAEGVTSASQLWHSAF